MNRKVFAEKFKILKISEKISFTPLKVEDLCAIIVTSIYNIYANIIY